MLARARIFADLAGDGFLVGALVGGEADQLDAGAGAGGSGFAVGAGPAGGSGLFGLLPGGVPVDAVVLVQAVFFVLGQVAPGVDVNVGGVLDLVLGVADDL
jgi:hypothetical protein